MRFAIGATVALAAAVVRADDASSAEADASSSASVPKPTFTVSFTLHPIEALNANSTRIANHS